MSDGILGGMLFLKIKSVINKRKPDFDYICREFLRNGVNKKSLREEYCEECCMNSKESLMY